MSVSFAKEDSPNYVPRAEVWDNSLQQIKVQGCISSEKTLLLGEMLPKSPG